MTTTMGRGHLLRQKLIAVTGALAIFTALIAVYAPVARAQIDISIPIDTVIHAPVGSSTLLATVETGDLAGQECRVSADAVNQNSVHPGNNLVVASNDSSVILENVEGASDGTVHADGILTLSETVTVTLIMGKDHVFSAGLTVFIDCEPVEQEGSVTVTSGSCTVGSEGEEPGFVDVVMDPDSSATVTVFDADENVDALFATSGSADLEPGDYTWEATAASGFVLVGDVSGSFSVEDCEEEEEPELADLEITKVDLVDPVVVDTDNPTAQITYDITVTNNGPAVAENVVVVDDLPDSLTYVSATSEAGTCAHSGGIVTCELGDMAVGASVKITIVAETEAVGEVSDLAPLNVVEVGSDTEDPDPSNNTDDEETNIVEVLDTDVVDPDVLPFTGVDGDMLFPASLLLLAVGAALLFVADAEEDELA